MSNKARSYVNKDGERISVTTEHLQLASRIKREIQMSVSSHRCNWKKHKEIMEMNGFDDSCISEGYRCLIKDWQGKNDQLDTRAKHEDYVAESKLEMIKQVVGEAYYTKREIQLESQKLNKMQRELAKTGIALSEITGALKDISINIPQLPILKNKKDKTKMFALISDWHIGVIVELGDLNAFNYKIATTRVQTYINKVLKIAKDNNISEITVVNCGDMIEGAYMRGSQAFEVEFTFGEQIAKATELLFDMLVKLSGSVKVKYVGIAGNHDRIVASKDLNADGDTAMKIVNGSIKQLINVSRSILEDRIEFIEADNEYSTTIVANERKIKFVHGDNESKGDGKLAKHSLFDEEIIDCLVYGHYHHFKVHELGRDKMEVQVGSIKGADNYSKRLKLCSHPSQAVMLVYQDGEIDARRVRV